MEHPSLIDSTISSTELAKLLGVSDATLTRWRAMQYGPKYLQLGHKIRYRQEDVDAWLIEQQVNPEKKVEGNQQ